MGIWFVEAGCALMAVTGLWLAFGRSPGPGRTSPMREGNDPRVYIRRIAGVMLAAFGLALGIILGIYHLS